jgi:hypothetical protein
MVLRPPSSLQNVVLYAGSGRDRDIIAEHEFWYNGARGPTRFNVLLASYETVLSDRCGAVCCDSLLLHLCSATGERLLLALGLRLLCLCCAYVVSCSTRCSSRILVQAGQHVCL